MTNFVMDKDAIQQYDELDVLYEDINSTYESIMEDCFGGLHKLFAASFPNHSDEDLKEIFAVIAWELCKAKAEIEKLKYLRDPDRVPEKFIAPLAAMLGIKEFPLRAFPEEQRRYLAYAYEIQKYKGTRYGLELLLKSLMPFDDISLFPMYRRGLRRYFANNDYTGGRRAGTQDAETLAKMEAGLPLGFLTQGIRSYPTGVYICIRLHGSRTDKVVKGLLTRIEPIIREFMPENAFFEVRLYKYQYFGPDDVIFQNDYLTIGNDALTITEPEPLPNNEYFLYSISGTQVILYPYSLKDDVVLNPWYTEYKHTDQITDVVRLADVPNGALPPLQTIGSYANGLIEFDVTVNALSNDLIRFRNIDTSNNLHLFIHSTGLLSLYRREAGIDTRIAGNEMGGFAVGNRANIKVKLDDGNITVFINDAVSFTAFDDTPSLAGVTGVVASSGNFIRHRVNIYNTLITLA